MTTVQPFVCSICEETSTRICVKCTKDTCANHLCEKCRACSDCCDCEIRLDEDRSEIEEDSVLEDRLGEHRLEREGLAHPQEPAPHPHPLPDPDDPEPEEEPIPGMPEQAAQLAEEETLA
jgi:hypothetical protein